MDNKNTLYIVGPSTDLVKLLESKGVKCCVVKSVNEIPKGASALFSSEELQKIAAESQKLSKLEVTVKQREEFLGVCAHDLRSPIGLVQSSLRMVLNANPPLQPLHLELLKRAERQATQGIQLVNDLLDVTVYEQGLKPQYSLVDLHAFLGEFHKDYQMKAQEKLIQFHYENEVTDWKVLIDTDRIRQLLQNLVTNAVKFTDTGKNIYLTVESFQGRRRSDPAYPMLIISIRDQGQGIPQAELQKIFDKFSQMKSNARGEGRGLGLTVARQISNLHDGNLWVESEEGKGTTFHVLIPHVLSVSQKTKPEAIVIAEPDQERRKTFFDPLKNWGHEIIYAQDGVDALSLIFYYQPKALLLSSELEKLPIQEVATTAKSEPQSCQIPIFFVAESGEIEKKKGFDGSLRLPLTQKAVETALNPKPLKKAA